MDESDDDLVNRFRGGDQRAADELYNRYVGKMLEEVRAHLWNVRRREGFSSDGIVNEGFRSFFSKLNKDDFDPDKLKIGGLLARIMFCKTMLRFRKQKRQQRRQSFAPETIADMVQAAIETSRRDDSEQFIKAWFQELTDAGDFNELERRILSLYLDANDERTIDEIAEVCECSGATVRATIKMFREYLKQRLDDERRRGENEG
ncbi:MAG: sigma-70 family RNA polymerase sigma factor [Planctomycetaceae bacterium]|nr:sigma-70 family RNA polymerase sigma factor [Planctomycetaceae bacterium]